MKMEELFNKILEYLEIKVDASSYYTWFAKLKPYDFDAEKNVMRIIVPINIYKDILKNHYNDIINEAVEDVYGKPITFEYYLEDEIIPSTVNTDNKIIKEESSDWKTNLDPTYTFDNFMVGDSNRLAYKNALIVAENPGTIHNPFFIYGRSGIGKTHLMHAIGNYIVKNTNLKVLYITSEKFKDEYINIITDSNNISNANEFKNKYQSVDVLIVDDIQFLVGAEKTQQEFFHTFNALYNSKKQIIISSDKSPEDLNKIEERLRSRLTWGLPVDIYPPELQLRCKIIRSKLRKRTDFEDNLSDEVIEYIANLCTTDVRQIEGAINKLLADVALFVPEKIDIPFVNEALKSYVKVNVYAENSMSKILKVVADYYQLEVSDLKSKKRTATVSTARAIAMYLCRMNADEKLERIGLEFGKDHSTVSAAVDKITKQIKNDVKLNTVIKELINKL